LLNQFVEDGRKDESGTEAFIYAIMRSVAVATCAQLHTAILSRDKVARQNHTMKLHV